MKKTERLRKEAEEAMDKVRVLTRHIRNVEDNCLFLGEKLILNGEIELGHHLIANGFVHDASKFFGIEWDYLSILPSKEEETKLKLKMAIQHHQKTNPHHIAYWSNKIENMPDVYLAEMICDLKARSEEFGTSLMDYIEECSVNKWNITKESRTYKRIVEFVSLLCQTPFQEIK